MEGMNNKLDEYCKKRVKNLANVQPGCHIIFENEEKQKSFHAIVDSVHSENEITFICYFDRQLFSEIFGDEILLHGACVRKITRFIDFDKIKVFIVQYFHVDNAETLLRARELNLKPKSSTIKDNNFNFIIECLTGKDAALFVIDTKKIGFEKLTEIGIPQNLAVNLIEFGGTVCVMSALKELAKSSSVAIANSTGMNAVKTVGELFGPALGILTESAKTGHDIVKKKKDMKNKKITRYTYKKFVAEEVTRSSHSIAGGLGGAALGQMIIPVPMLGATIGGILGGLIGTVIGYGNAKLVGKAMDSVQTKIRLKELSKSSLEKILVSDNTVFYFYNDPDELMQLTDRSRVNEMMNLDSNLNVFQVEPCK